MLWLVLDFFLTTPIYYVNDKPHIGHAYTTILCDVLARYRRLFDEKVFFLTGTDEHGAKVAKSAKSRNLSETEHVDSMVVNFQKTWKELEVKEDFFIRTTMDFHKKAVQAALMELWDKGEIYEKDYEGWYSESEEVFYPKKDLVDGRTPMGNTVELIREKNYFFKMSKYQDRLLDYIEKNPKFIMPGKRKNEILGFLKKPLGDLSISRPKSRLSWGIDIPFDTSHVTYVWFDALLNYATAVGYKQNKANDKFEKIWPQVFHVIGKDILMTHAIYWPCMLMALDLPLPKMIFAHGWWLTDRKEKMSKSRGKVISPLDLKSVVGVDGLRYFLMRDMSLGQDAQFSKELAVTRVNTELSNNLGNLLSRTTKLIEQYFDGKPPKGSKNTRLELEAKEVAKKVKDSITDLKPNDALEAVVSLLNKANKFMEEVKPWKILKEGNIKLGAECLYNSLEVLRVSAILLSPVMPSKTKELLTRIGDYGEPKFEDACRWGLLKDNPVKVGSPLFPRIKEGI